MAEMSGDGGKKRGIDDIIEHMTADLQSYEGQYILLGGSPGGHTVWNDYPQQPPPTPPQAFFPQQLSSPEMYRYVVLGKTAVPDYNPQVGLIYPAPPPNLMQSHHMDYSSNRGFNDTGGGGRGRLIENVVGNWAPNLNGTYSPFGSSAKDEVSSMPNVQPPVAAPQQPPAPVRKQRIVAEVKPMRPSYSDVVAKSPPLTPPPTIKQTVKPILTPNNLKTDSAKQKNAGKSTANNQGFGKGGVTLKRQNSSGSDEGFGVGKQKSVFDHWSSLEDLTGFSDCNFKDKPAEETIRKRRKNKSSGTKQAPEKDDKSDMYKAFENSYTLSRNSRSESPQSSDNEAPPASKNCSSQTMRSPQERTSSKPRPRDKDERKESNGIHVVKSPSRSPCQNKVSKRAYCVSRVENQVKTPSVKKSTKQKRRNCSKNDSGSSSKSERASSSRGSNAKNKRSQRAYKKRESSFGLLMKKWQEQSSYFLVFLTTWLVNLLWDVTAMSASLFVHMCGVVCEHGINWMKLTKEKTVAFFKKWKWWGKKSQRFSKKSESPPLPGSLTHNITLPATGEEAMKRLLSCKGKDPYSILGVTSTCTDEEIKKYYKSQALLVHPDKNSQPGAEEAFKILVHAFDLIAEPEKRAAYDRYVAETNQVEQAWSELSDLLSQLHEKMEYAANTIRCNNCGKRHKRELTERPSYAARYCAQCKIHHAAKEGDMWAESRYCGWSCRYYACMGGSVYDITQWANCQGGGVQRVKPDAHTVQYRVLLGRHQPPQPEQDFEDLLNSLYSQNGSGKRGKKKPKKNK